MRISRDKKKESLLLNIYRELYRESTPPADFDKLMDEATINELGQKTIDFMSYEIEDDKLYKIIEDSLTVKSCGMRLSKYEKRAIKNTIILGCSPKTKTH
jgi:hypothetical protein